MSMDQAQGSMLGRYRILAELGRGAMGVVSKAEDTLLNRTVAIKTILLSSDAVERSDYEARFAQEAKAAGGLNHPNIITIHDMGREGDVVYMAMELLEGVELRNLIRQRELTLPLALEIAAQVAEGLAFAHAHGVVHRDIKPANIMIVHGTHAKIMDFGIAKIRLSDVKTQTGMVLGSPKYMSPEQVAGTRADHRSDIFSLGVMLYEMATGQPPFSASDVGQLMYQVSKVMQRPPSAVNAGLPTMLDLIAARALAKDPESRYQSAREMAADLRACRAQLGDAAPGGTPAANAQEPAAEFGTTIQAARSAETPVPNMRLSLSRRFDSSAALRRLTDIDGATTQIAAAPRRMPGDRLHLQIALAIGAAVIAALAIALL